MPRAALLIGVSRYSSGLTSLPRVQNDVELMRRVLIQRQFGFKPVVCLCDAPLQTMQEEIETFFKNCHPDDQVLFLLAGHGIQAEDGRLYFATPETVPDAQGRLLRARAIAASFIQDVMNASPARHQVLVLDCPLQKGFGSRLLEDDPIDLEEQLGGDRRVILTASIFTHHITEVSDLDTWSYTRYLADGIETGAIDSNRNGEVSAQDLDNYVRRKLRIAAPAMNPQIYGSDESSHLPLLKLPIDDSRVRYRKVLEGMGDRVATDPTTTKILGNRDLLDATAYSLELSAQEAAEIEAASLQPRRDYYQRLQAYRERFGHTKLEVVESNYQPSEDELKQHRQSLGLTDEDTAGIEAEPLVRQQQQQRKNHQDDLNRYEQILLFLMQRQGSLGQGEAIGDGYRPLLRHLRDTLGLQDDEAQVIERDLVTRLNRRMNTTFVPEPYPSETQPPAGEPNNLAANSLPPTQIPQPERPIQQQRQPTAAPGQFNPLQGQANSLQGQPNPLPGQSNPLPGQPNPLQQGQSAPTRGQTVTTIQSEQSDPALQNVSYNRSQPPPQAGMAGNSQPAISPPERVVNAPAGQPAENLQSPSPAQVAPVVGNPTPETPVQASVSQEVTPKERDMSKPKKSKLPLWLWILPAVLLAALGGIWFAFSSARQPGNSLGTKPPPPPDVSTPAQTPIKQAAGNISLGVTAHKNGKLDDAIKSFNDAIGILSNDCNSKAGDNLKTANCRLLAVAYSNRSYAYFDQQNYTQAFNDATQAVSLDPNLPDATVNLANARFKRGDQNGALQDYEQALQLNPNNVLKAGIYNNRGNVYFAQKNYQTALNDYNRALNLLKNYADAFYNRGLANEALGNIQNAISDFQKAAKFYNDQNNFDLEKEANNRIANLKQQPSKGNSAPSSNSTNL